LERCRHIQSSFEMANNAPGRGGAVVRGRVAALVVAGLPLVAVGFAAVAAVNMTLDRVLA
jgi:hypothetical protein